MAIKPMEPPKTESPPPGAPGAAEAGRSMLFRTPEARAFLLGIGMFAPAVLYIALLIVIPFGDGIIATLSSPEVFALTEATSNASGF